MKLGMVIDATVCTGCEACTLACKLKNGAPTGVWLARVLEKEDGVYPRVTKRFIPILCYHCANPSCVAACPTRSISKRADGIVVVDSTRCCGSKACMQACPYDALHFFYPDTKGEFGDVLTPLEEYWRKSQRPGTVMKCDFCADRVAQGQEPACVQACPTTARVFGDLTNPDSEVAQLIKRKSAVQLQPEQGLDPAVYYIL